MRNGTMTKANGRPRQAAEAFAAAAVLLATTGAVAMACSVGDGRVTAGPESNDAGDPSTQDASPLDGATCRDALSLCKANNVVCGPVLVRDEDCNVDRVVDCGICVGELLGDGGMIGVRGSIFQMGNALPTAAPEEKPQHVERIADVFVDRFEVSVDAYTDCVAHKACTPAGTGGACNFGLSERGAHPINCVDWYQANAFCSYRGHRLPTEAEWEYIGRGGVALRTYPWGNQSPTGLKSDAGLPICWGGTADAGTLGSTCTSDRPDNLDTTSQGVRDLGANVREWTSDGWSANYDAGRSPVFRVMRGGGWFSDLTTESVNAIHRRSDVAIARSADVGFRCIRPLLTDGGVDAGR